MTKHDRNWTFALIVLAITIIVGPCFWARADDTEVAQPTCEQNAIHIATAKTELDLIGLRFVQASDDQKPVIAAEGDFMVKVLKMLQKWRETNHCDA